MENKNTSAFPLFTDYGEGDKGHTDGLTKRELIAAMAMQGLLSGLGLKETNGIGYSEKEIKNAVNNAIFAADALLNKLETE